MRHDIRLVGFGGQGILLAGYVLGKAASLYDGKEAVFTQSYGPEARGGACAAQVVISDEPVDYPLFEQADCLVAMSQEGYEKHGRAAAPDSLIIVDSDLIKAPQERDGLYCAPFTRTAEGLGNRIVANIVMLGYLSGVTGLVSPEALEESIRTSVRARFVDLNLRAFGQGYAQAKQPEVVA